MARQDFSQMLTHRSVEALIAANDPLPDWTSSAGAQLRTAATVIAMRQVDRAATRLQYAALALAVAGLVLAAITVVRG